MTPNLHASKSRTPAVTRKSGASAACPERSRMGPRKDHIDEAAPHLCHPEEAKTCAPSAGLPTKDLCTCRRSHARLRANTACCRLLSDASREPKPTLPFPATIHSPPVTSALAPQSKFVHPCPSKGRMRAQRARPKIVPQLLCLTYFEAKSFRRRILRGFFR